MRAQRPVGKLEDEEALAFDAREWALGHEKLDNARFTLVFRVLTLICTVFVALASWSLKTQYEAMAQSQKQTAAELSALRAVAGQVAHVDSVVTRP